MLFASATHDPKKNPVDYDTKVGWLKSAYGKIVKHLPKNQSNLIGVLKHVGKTHNHLHLVAGADRHKEFSDLIKKYNGKEFRFKSVSFHIPPRGYSASQMRDHAKTGDFASFESHVPRVLRDRAREMYDTVRAGMGIKDVHEIFGPAGGTVDLGQNINVLLYLGMAEKSLLDVYKKVWLDPWSAFMVPQYRPILLRIFKIMRDIIFDNSDVYNRVKLDLVQARGGEHEHIHEGLTDGAIDLLLRLGLDDVQYAVVNRRIIKNPEIAINDSFLRKKLFDLFVKFRRFVVADNYIFTRAQTWIRNHRGTYREEKSIEALRKKARYYGVPFDVVLEVFDRGCSAGGNVATRSDAGDDVVKAFARVNSFLEGGAARELDRDLLESRRSFGRFLME